MTEKGKNQRRREEDAAFNRMLLWLAGAAVVELIVLLIKRIYVDFWLDVDAVVALNAFFRVFQFAGIALTAAGIAWIAVSVRNGKGWRLSAALTGAAAVLWVVSLLAYQLYDLGITILTILPGGAAVLILIFFLYQRTFFVDTAITGGAIAALWLFRTYRTDHPTLLTLCFILGWVLLAAAAALAWKLRGSNGRLGSLQLMPDGSVYGVIFATCALSAAALLLAYLLGETAAFYLLFVLMAWLFGQAVYFTVKLM